MPLKEILRLAIPVILAELGWMFMGVIDTMMVGPLGPSAIGAVSIGNALFDVTGIFGIGLLLGLDTLVSQAYGAGKRDECDRWLWQGLWLAIFAAALLMLAVEAIIPVMRLIGRETRCAGDGASLRSGDELESVAAAALLRPCAVICSPCTNQVSSCSRC